MTTDEARRRIEEALELQRRLGISGSSLDVAKTIASSHIKASEAVEILRASQEELSRLNLSGGALRDVEMPYSVQVHSRTIKEVQDRLGVSSPIGDLSRSLPSGLASSVETVLARERFRLPGSVELGDMARSVMTASSLASTVLETRDQLERTLGCMQTPWAQLDQGITSARALADIIAMAHGIGRFGGFDPSFASALRPVLGDWRDAHLPATTELLDPRLRFSFYLEQGFDPNLTTFSSEAFDESLSVSGFLDSDQDGDLEFAEGLDSDDQARAERAFALLRHFEIAVRQFIQNAMETHFGEKWMKQQIPLEMRLAWQEKRETAIKSGQNPGSMIDFADFSDYKMIIERSDNWNKVFKPVFGRKEDVQESFLRLQPVRIATMHSRLVTKEDHLLLLVESKRVLSAINGP